jgi:type II secretory ATPase GspE/PulE/Tfp pilus assembly ATPase PilB-like protein
MSSRSNISFACAIASTACWSRPTFRRRCDKYHAAIVSRLKILSHLDIAEKRLPQDGRIRLKVAGREIDLRVSVIPMIHGEAVVLRILDRGDAMLGLEHLGMSLRDRNVWDRVLDLPHGIILVTGPTGSGKTTTLYAALSKINTADLKIITIEDPVEYQLAGSTRFRSTPNPA